VVKLTTSFRSVPEIQACVNAAFAPVMTGDAATLQADYVPLSEFRPPLPAQPAVVALPVPEPYGARALSAIAIEKSLPDAVGGFVDWVVNESGWKVTERTGDRPVRVAARHVCILFRRFISFGEDVTQPYVRALEARGVSHVLVGGKTFHDREEVETIRAALAAVEWPDDELSVFAALRGALFAVGDEELLEWRHRFGGFHPFRIPEPFRADPSGRTAALTHLAPVASALALLAALHRRRNYVPVAETIQRLLDSTRAHVGFVLRAGGEQTLANVLHIAELARQYEADGGISFRGFVEELRLAAESAEAAEAPILEEGSDGVRMMTVHKAKGLEFPVVILADITCRLSRAEAGRWIDPDQRKCALKLGGWAPLDLLLHDAEEAARDRAEAERLAYVAATRARDLLVVPAIGDGPYDGGWLDPLTPAVYPPPTSRRDARRGPGCPDFRSKDSVLSRPDNDPARADTVAPGLHRFAARRNPESRTPNPGYSVVWWDPHALHLHAASSFGLRRDDLIVKDGDMFAVEDRLSEYQRWREERARVVEQGSRPSLRVERATTWAAAAAEAGIDEEIEVTGPVEVVTLPGAEGRPRGPRFGTLVHAVLATVPLEGGADLVARTAATQGRLLLATQSEVEAAASLVSAVLAHELMDRARRARSVAREAPVSWVQKGGLLIEGVLDLAFDDGETTTVVDFKTDHELAAGESRYRAQLRQYVSAVARVTGRPASGILFRV
jgi:ATP-dependent exoDNAse (exonuclease V) beta subunit